MTGKSAGDHRHAPHLITRTDQKDCPVILVRRKVKVFQRSAHQCKAVIIQADAQDLSAKPRSFIYKPCHRQFCWNLGSVHERDKPACFPFTQWRLDPMQIRTVCADPCVRDPDVLLSDAPEQSGADKVGRFCEVYACDAWPLNQLSLRNRLVRCEDVLPGCNSVFADLRRAVHALRDKRSILSRVPAIVCKFGPHLLKQCRIIAKRRICFVPHSLVIDFLIRIEPTYKAKHSVVRLFAVEDCFGLLKLIIKRSAADVAVRCDPCLPRKLLFS